MHLQTLICTGLLCVRPRVRGICSALLPVADTLEDIINKSLDRRAQQALRTPLQFEEPRLLSLKKATADDWRLVVDSLAPFLREKKVRTLAQTLLNRRAHLHLVVENVQDPHNSVALMRTAEALGLQHVHVIESVNRFALPTQDSRATSRGSIGRTAQDGSGASRWLSVHKYESASDAVEALHALGVKIYVSDCPTADDDEEEAPAVDEAAASAEAASPLTLQQRLEAKRRAREGAKEEVSSTNEGAGWVVPKRERRAEAIDELDFSSCFEGDGRGAALVFGNERRGVSRVMSEGADASFYLPMSGFTQSFNIGTALAMVRARHRVAHCVPACRLARPIRQWGAANA